MCIGLRAYSSWVRARRGLRRSVISQPTALRRRPRLAAAAPRNHNNRRLPLWCVSIPHLTSYQGLTQRLVEWLPRMASHPDVWGHHARMHTSAACRAFVGGQAPAAREYHDADFDWEDLRVEAEPLLAARRAAWASHRASLSLAGSAALGAPLDAYAAPPAGCAPFQEEGWSSAQSGPAAFAGPAAAAGSGLLEEGVEWSGGCPPQVNPPVEQCSSANDVGAGSGVREDNSLMLGRPSAAAGNHTFAAEAAAAEKRRMCSGVVSAKSPYFGTNTANLMMENQELAASHGPGAGSCCWEAFHARDNATARFYKERRYLTLEFPALLRAVPPPHFVEIGCGAGSTLIPILKANPAARGTGVDVSPTAVQLFLQAAASAKISPGRVAAFPLDAVRCGEGHALAGLGADAVLLVFTLAAVAPENMPRMLRTAAKALRPGGLLLVRDHGLYDITQLRIPPERQLADNLYRRSDGTLCYFFSREELTSLVVAAGFATLECSYACTKVVNRAKHLTMRRVFVHGVFRRLAQPADT